MRVPLNFMIILLNFMPCFCWSGNDTSTSSSHFISKRSIRFAEFAKYTTPEIIYKSGYPVEVHKVLTKDGYILEMHRIPRPHHSMHIPPKYLPGKGRVVYIQHCVLCSSGDFVINDPRTAISFVLADAGFDVWLGNYRGNFYSKNHIYLDPDEKDFWKFSFMEMADYDIPAMIYYVLGKTGANKLAYVGHSMGTTGLFAALAMNPEVNDKISVMGALAPVAYMTHVKSLFRVIFLGASYMWQVLEAINIPEIGGRKLLNAEMAIKFCGASSRYLPICKMVLPAFMGFNPGYINDEHLAVVLSHLSTGASARTLAHFGQMTRTGDFSMFNKGSVANLEAYGTIDPPPFDLRNTKIPVGLFWAENDFVASPLDVRRLANILPNVVLDYKIPQEDFNHTDFLFSRQAYQLVFKQLLELLLRYSTY